MKVRLQDRISARELRRHGLSFTEIISRIPNLSKGTLNGWLKDIELTPKQKRRLLEKMKIGADKARLKGAFTNHQKRVKLTEYIINEARKEIKRGTVDNFCLAGLMLYWAEGDKTQERVGFTNADPLMVQFMMRWFRNICEVPETKFRIALSIITLHNRDDAERFWTQITGVSLSQFNKTRIKPTSLKGKRNPSYMGTCRIIVSNKGLFRKIKGWRLGILEKFELSAPIA